jgi:superfamily II DNA/RNA helicase
MSKRKVTLIFVGCGEGKTRAIFRLLREYSRVLYLTANSGKKGLVKEIRPVFGPEFNLTVDEAPKGKGTAVFILNYEKLLSYREQILSFNPEAIVLDEAHYMKNLGTERYKRLKGFLSRIQLKHMIAATATPVANNLLEFKSLMELITGEPNPHLRTALTDKNLYEAHTYLRTFNPTVLPSQHAAKLLPIDLMVDRAALRKYPALKQVVESGDVDFKEVQKLTAEMKLDAVGDKIKHALVFTEYRPVARHIAHILKGRGYDPHICTGEVDHTIRDRKKNQFIASVKAGKKSVMICTRAMSTSVDGFQKVCSRQIWVTVPFSPIVATQQEGRTIRIGGKANNREIIIPMVHFKSHGQDYSIDRVWYDRMRSKKALLDVIRTGDSKDIIFDAVKVRRQLSDSFKEFKKRVKKYGLSFNEAPEPLAPSELLEDIKHKNHITEFEKEESIRRNSNSETTHKRLKACPEINAAYYKKYRQAAMRWPEKPREILEALLLKQLGAAAQDRKCRVADLGSGPFFPIGKEPGKHRLGCTVTGFDHTSQSSLVVSKDISRTGQRKNSFDAVTLCLSLQGKNWQDYLTEAARICKPNGSVLVAETYGRKEGAKKVLSIKRAMRKAGLRVNSEKLGSPAFYVQGLKTA